MARRSPARAGRLVLCRAMARSTTAGRPRHTEDTQSPISAASCSATSIASTRRPRWSASSRSSTRSSRPTIRGEVEVEQAYIERQLDASTWAARGGLFLIPAACSTRTTSRPRTTACSATSSRPRSSRAPGAKAASQLHRQLRQRPDAGDAGSPPASTSPSGTPTSTEGARVAARLDPPGAGAGQGARPVGVRRAQLARRSRPAAGRHRVHRRRRPTARRRRARASRCGICMRATPGPLGPVARSTRAARSPTRRRSTRRWSATRR